jgi:Cu-Zn family superoxide dismutase
MINKSLRLLIALLIAVASAVLGSRYYYYSPFYSSIKAAIAVIHPTAGNSASGVVIFHQKKDGVQVTVTINGLTPGEHGFHIHAVGDCSCADGTCAGGHFNPTNTLHGAPNNLQRHAGDMGNVLADANGNASYEYVDKVMALNGPRSIIGRAVIVHEKGDDLVSQPTGDAGARVGCGVIGIQGAH